MRSRLASAVQSLQVRNYRLFATGQLVKLLGVWAMFTAQDWLVLQLSGDSATALGLVTALQFIPVLLLTLYGGRLADRYDKRRLLIAANAAWAVLAVLFAVLVASGAVTLWHVYVFAAAMGVAAAIETPIRQSFVSELVGATLLPNALSLSAATFNSARILGPALAGLALATIDIGPTFVLSAALAVAPVATFLRMRTADLYRDATRPGGPARIRDGLRYVRSRPDLLVPIALMSVVGLIGLNFTVTLAALAKTTFHTGPAAFGLLTTALAAGALVGALVSGGRRARPSVYVVAGAAAGFGALEIAVGLAPTFLAASALLVPTGFFMVLFGQAANQRVQMGTDPRYRGRVMALYVLVFLGTTPIGAPLVGWIAEHVGPGASIWIGGVGSLAVALVALAWKLHRTGERLAFRFAPLPRLSVVPSPDC
ncbi:MFS transporter [Pilimelia terevasa]|uniref:MFS transporter n=1 Tax=Pilimelia terevasa TaxID=53372 RepID=A0A8J3FFY8_9ACTN|nr:MFS transporter [Pilimelia terevasa]GGK20059.1 MFS transporter [Pilimelia terevasa]